LEKRVAGWRARIDALAIEVQVNPGAVQLAKEPEEILKAAAESIDAPRRDHVKFVPGDRLVQAIKAGPLVAPVGTAHALIGELGHDTPAAAVNRSLQVRAAGSRRSVRPC
jgi:hypothetical protein